jgi:hypothetical protein
MTFREINMRDRYSIEIAILSESTSRNFHVGERLCTVQTLVSTFHAPRCQATERHVQCKRERISNEV